MTETLPRLSKVRELDGWQGVVWLVKDNFTGEHYAISRAFTSDRGDETMIFACNDQGQDVDFMDLWVDHGVDHEYALDSFSSQLSDH